MQKEYITDYLNKTSEIGKWNIGDNIIISAPVGSGKSHFIKNELYLKAKSENKKILLIVSRLNCKNQFEEEINREGKEDIITLMTYQKLDHMEYKDIQIELNHYDYIVCDEFHYFLSDASFNKLTDLSFNVLNNIKNSIKIFLSATSELIELFMKQKIINFEYKYIIKPNYDYIKEVIFIPPEDKINFFEIEIMNMLTINTKAIFFIQSAKFALDLHLKHKSNTLFNCSKSSKYYKYADEEEINNMLKFEKFNKNILLTTLVMETGVNIKDKELNYIFIDIDTFDIDTIIQCSGRKRIINDEDNLIIYIVDKNKRQLSARLNNLKNQIEPAEYLRTKGEDAYLNKYNRDAGKHDLIYYSKHDKKFQYNELMYFKTKKDIQNIEKMLKYPNGYSNFIFKKFKTDKKIRLKLSDEFRKNKLNILLEGFAKTKKELDQEGKKYLINQINYKVDGKLKKSRRKLNEVLKLENYKYYIDEKRVDDKRLWVVKKI